MEITLTVNYLDNVVHTQPNAQPIYNTPEVLPINTSSSSALFVQDNTNAKKTDTLILSPNIIAHTIDVVAKVNYYSKLLI